MTSDEARELFSAALEGELAEGPRAALEAALATDPALAEEYAAFGRMVALAREAAGLAAERGPGARPEGPDLLPGVQRTLRVRSGGRFYADRFAERQGSARLTAWLIAATLLLLLFALLAALHTLGGVY